MISIIINTIIILISSISAAAVAALSSPPPPPTTTTWLSSPYCSPPNSLSLELILPWGSVDFLYKHRPGQNIFENNSYKKQCCEWLRCGNPLGWRDYVPPGHGRTRTRSTVWKNIHYDDVIMSAMASQITLTIVYSTVHSGADQRKHQSSASLAFVRGIHRWPVNSPHKGTVTGKMFPFDDVIMRHMKTSWVGNAFHTAFLITPRLMVIFLFTWTKCWQNSRVDVTPFYWHILTFDFSMDRQSHAE